MFLATVADGQTAASCGKGKTNCKHSPRVRFWVGPHWWGLGRSLNVATCSDWSVPRALETHELPLHTKTITEPNFIIFELFSVIPAL